MIGVCMELQCQTPMVCRKFHIWNFWTITVKMSVLMNWADGIGPLDICHSLFSVLRCCKDDGSRFLEYQLSFCYFLLVRAFRQFMIQ